MSVRRYVIVCEDGAGRPQVRPVSVGGSPDDNEMHTADYSAIKAWAKLRFGAGPLVIFAEDIDCERYSWLFIEVFGDCEIE